MKIRLTREQIEGIARKALELDVVCEDKEDVQELLKLIGTQMAEKEGHWPRNGLIQRVESVSGEVSEGYSLSVTPLMAHYISLLLKEL